MHDLPQVQPKNKHRSFSHAPDLQSVGSSSAKRFFFSLKSESSSAPMDILIAIFISFSSS